MTPIDWLIVLATVVGSLMIGLHFAKRASRSGEDYFVAGRSLGWLLAGTSMVATTFSADTPLFVSGMVRREGIYANWIWWSMVPAALGTTFFFARLWRRMGAITEVEFIVRRYGDGVGVHALRIMRALYDGVFTNAIIMASVTLAMSKILVVVLGLSSEPIFHFPGLGAVTPSVLLLIGLGGIALVYTVISGLYGVVYTDCIQFCMAMTGAILLGAIVYADLGGWNGFASAIHGAPGFREGFTLAMVPDLSRLDLHSITFLILISVGWIGAMPGSGHFVQRMLATRTERDAMLSMYWYAFTNYVLRSWPWIVAGLASMVYFPALTDHERAYPTLVNTMLPIGLKGVMVASLISAFMSTLTTQMNWGTSYLINDVYRPYLVKGREPHHYVTAARVAMLLLVLVALVASTQLGGILQAYKYLATMTAGGAFVMVARWYWWRVNVWTEIVSITVSLIVGISMFWLLPDSADQDYFAIRLATNISLTTICAVATTLLTAHGAPAAHVEQFHRQLQIGGAGWRRLHRITGVAPATSNLGTSTIAWLASVALIYSLLFGIGYALLGQLPALVWASAACVVSLAILWRTMPTVLADLAALKREPEARFIPIGK